ncbi:MAG: rhodanese-like domain-containing protein [Myxococcaceae bacterium]|nr:rhodanese-like domain-containing protein [Myxococcaceae bacterium]
MTTRVAVLLCSLSFAACASPSITGEQAHALVDTQRAVLLDVRTPDEFRERHLGGAVNLPVQALEAREAEVPAKPDQDVIVYCRSGHRSARAAELLKARGFSKVHDLGSMSNWR